MPQVALLPIIAGMTSGMSVIPILAIIIQMFQRKAHLKREQQRLKNTTFILSGTIGDSQLASHIRSLCKLERQGVLHIITGRRKGYVLFRDGEIIDGFYRNLAGVEGLKELIELTEGDYFFESRAVYQPNLIHSTVDQLLQEELNQDE